MHRCHPKRGVRGNPPESHSPGVGWGSAKAENLSWKCTGKDWPIERESEPSAKLGQPRLGKVNWPRRLSDQVALEREPRKEEDVISKILVGLDGSSLAESVLPHAEALARASDATLVLVRVVSVVDSPAPLQEQYRRLYPFRLAPPPSNTNRDPSSPEVARHDAERYLLDVGKSLGERGIANEIVVGSGEPASVIVTEAELRHADLIALCTHGRSGVGRWIYGSVAEKVLAQSTMPVLLSRAWTKQHELAPADKSPRLVVPLDGSPLAEKVLPPAINLARSLGAELRLVMIVPDTLDAPRDEEVAGDYLDAWIYRLRAEGVGMSIEVRRGHPADGILASATDASASLIVMATHGRTGLASALMGSVALEVLHRGNLPIVLVRPAGKAATDDGA